MPEQKELSGKPVAAICHGPWTLIDAGLVDGRRMTSYHAIQCDLKNAGAQWVDEEVVVARVWSPAGAPTIFPRSTTR